MKHQINSVAFPVAWCCLAPGAADRRHHGWGGYNPPLRSTLPPGQDSQIDLRIRPLRRSDGGRGKHWRFVLAPSSRHGSARRSRRDLIAVGKTFTGWLRPIPHTTSGRGANRVHYSRRQSVIDCGNPRSEHHRPAPFVLSGPCRKSVLGSCDAWLTRAPLSRGRDTAHRRPSLCWFGIDPWLLRFEVYSIGATYYDPSPMRKCMLPFFVRVSVSARESAWEFLFCFSAPPNTCGACRTQFRQFQTKRLLSQRR